MLFLKTKNLKQKTKNGFSIVEMLVTVAIIVLITTLILINHTVFNGGVVLESLAYEIALTVRQAQFFGINVLQAGVGSNATFSAPYGVYFSSDPTGDQNRQFLMFADIQENGKYEKSTSDVIVEVYNITRGNIVKYLCVDSKCNNPESSGIKELYITFKRPDPDAMFEVDTNDCNTACSYAKIFVGSKNPKVKDKVIKVTSTGQISIGNE